MKRALLALAFISVTLAAPAQTKEEIKAQKKAEKAEARRVKDSIKQARDSARWAQVEEYYRKLEEEEERQRKEWEEYQAKKGATSLRVITGFANPKEALDALVSALLCHNITPAYIDKDYFILKTERKMVGGSTYEMAFTIHNIYGKVQICAKSTAYGNIGVAAGYVFTNTEMVVPVKYGGMKNSISDIAWRNMLAIISELPHENPQYIKE